MLKGDCKNMKIVILAGGLGTRISEESHLKPKPMIEIGERPILWHIMKEYSKYGYNEFIICAGYKQYIIKEYFNNYFLHNSDVTFDIKNNKVLIHHKHAEDWIVTVVDTGLTTMTGGRIKRIQEYVGNETFMLTYGDAVSNVNIRELENYHKSHGRIGTITVYNFGQSKGVVDIAENGEVSQFREKSSDDGAFINIGYMVFEPDIFKYIDNDQTVLEKEPMERLADMHQLMCYKHDGFWQCMDTLREKQQLEKLWNSGNAPWKVWKD